jgi:ribulose-phosphate 3-epimerase
MKQHKISASILAADFARLGEEAMAVIAAGADMIHFDVMDNHYVPNLTLGPGVCKALVNYGIKVPLDVHLMAKPVDQLILDFSAAGATRITIHPEATEHLDRSLHLIKQQGCQAGLAFNPATPLNYLEYILDKLDSILIMSVNPGFGGQQFIPTALTKIAQAHAIVKQHALPISIQVDGGVKIDNIAQIAAAGADNFVAGSAIFGTNDYAQTIKAMRQALATV